MRENKMKIRKLDRSEHEKTRNLWEQVFSEDSQEFVDYYYYIKTKDNTIYVVEEEDEIRAMLQLNPYQVKLQGSVIPSDYIVGVATQAEYRGRGYMRNLLIHALQDQYSQKMPFTFLMPAAEAIYYPYDFRFVYDQKQIELDEAFFSVRKEYKNDEYRNVSQERIVDRDARFMDAGKMAAFVEENFSDCWNVVALRNAQYYQTQILEQQSEFGGMRLVFEEEKVVCMYAYAKEEGLEIREPLYLEGKESLLWASVDGLREPGEKVMVYGLEEIPDCLDGEKSVCKDVYKDTYKEKPVIMVRIVHLQELFSKMKIPSECEIHCSFAVIDPILHKNSRIWKLNSSKGEESLNVSETEDSQGVLSIAALTEILFGYKTPEEIRAEESVILTEELEEELRKLQNFCPIFLNEIV